MCSGDRDQHVHGSRDSRVRARHTKRAMGKFRPVGAEVGKRERGWMGKEDRAPTPEAGAILNTQALQQNC